MIRIAEKKDVSQLMAIYNYFILHSTATFDTEEKSYEDREMWFDEHQGRYCIFVCEENGMIEGYASLSRYRDRKAFDATVEVSVYIHPDCQGRKIGSKLMAIVLNYARHREDIKTVVSLITSENTISIHLHETFGFTYCGQIHNAGTKFGRKLHLNAYQICLD